MSVGHGRHQGEMGCEKGTSKYGHPWQEQAGVFKKSKEAGGWKREGEAGGGSLEDEETEKQIPEGLSVLRDLFPPLVSQEATGRSE